MLFFLQHGYRVIAHDRRGHGRSTQTDNGHDMDHYADDLAAVTEHLDLHDAIHVGHSTGGVEVARYIARHGGEARREGSPDQRSTTTHGANRLQPRWPAEERLRRARGTGRHEPSAFYRELPATAFYGFNRDGVEPMKPLSTTGGARE